MNMTILSGRLTKDAQLTHIGVNNTPKLKFSIAVERNYQKDKQNKVVDYIDMELLGTRAENLCKYLVKGKMVLCHGELNIDKYINNENETRYATKVKVDKIEFLSSNNQGNNIENKPVVNKNDEFDIPTYENKEKSSKNENNMLIDDDDVPF